MPFFCKLCDRANYPTYCSDNMLAVKNDASGTLKDGGSAL